MLYKNSLTTQDPIRQLMRVNYRADENRILAQLLPIAEIDDDSKSRAWEYARKLVVNIRKDQVGKGGVDALLNEFSLSTNEGIVLMCLAEALLRVPDKHTLDRLIRDKLAEGDWGSHIGNSDSIFVNASSWGLLMTGKLVNYSDDIKKIQFGLLKQTVGRLGEPVIRESVKYAMKIMGTQFVMGKSIDNAIERAINTESKGYCYSYDMLGEGARTMADADRYFDSYINAIEAIGIAAKNKGPLQSPGISIKLSAIHPRYEFSHRERVLEEIIPRLKTLAIAAKRYDIGFTVDAEEANRLDLSLDVIEAVFTDPELAGWDGFGLAIQAYQKRALQVIEWCRNLTLQTERKMMIRLVKGAYWDSEIKDSQAEGYHDFPVFTQKPSTDVSYQACARVLLSYRDTIYPQFATHNAYTVATILELAAAEGEAFTGFEFQRLHGMGESLYDQVVTQKQVACRVYAPVGKHEDLLAYLVRRLLENGANSSFVNNIVDEKIPVESLLSDPVETVESWSNKVNRQIPQSRNLYKDGVDKAIRINSKGIDLTDADQLSLMKSNLDTWCDNNIVTQAVEGRISITNPANHNEILGHVDLATHDEMAEIIEKTNSAFATWSQTSVQYRAEILLNIADALEAHRDELIALCAKEAGKTVPDGVSEVREAVDFCRYYAARAEEVYADNDVEARGVVLCISPWNFPLAIFLGQVSAAIVVGNTVIAKPAEQTSLIAIRTVEIMRQCGLPESVVELVIARGSEVGQVIVPDERIKTVMFTGSTETGTLISQTLAARDSEPVPLIAETGGQNCMIVDSTALPEQVVDDVIASGFQSAGQRCSALRVLFVQEEIADKIIGMVKGAMKELHLGDPALLSTDIGPVIDNKALSALNAHVDYLNSPQFEFEIKTHFVCDEPELAPEIKDGQHHFFLPRLVEIKALSTLKKEVFGPIVHVIRYKAKELEDVINEINNTGFGLTMGIHTRIEEKAKYLASRSRAGNVYVNRNMIGAVVGVQPFGGRDLSGTGPKAGGPMYLNRLVQDKVQNEDIELSKRESLELDKEIEECKDDKSMVEDITQQAKNHVLLWRFTPVNTRISVLRQLIAELSSSQEMIEQKLLITKTIKDARAQLLMIDKAMANPKELPGPTGESNTLMLESRGILVCIRCKDTPFDFWLMSIISSIAAGNCVLALVDKSNLVEAEIIKAILTEIGLPEGVFQVIEMGHLPTLMLDSHISGAILSTHSPLLKRVTEHIAARQGAILPVITAYTYRSLFRRLVTEKTVTIDTTAAGGNASLMTMETLLD